VRLFLFDIDGTLVSVRGAGRAAFARALEEIYGTAGTIERYDFRGRTDLRMVHDLMTEAGLDVEQIRARVDDFFRVYARELTRIIGDGSRIQVLPGVADVVRRLGARPDAVVGLLTGNVEAGARIKLEPTGLWPFFRVAAYGSDDADRRRLPAIARQRARALGHEFAFDRITIIGDTPLDVECARGCGAVAVAVATGQYPVEQLATCRPDLLFSDLADVERVVARLADGAP
jgi:phosphoglycolate phosphatase-like HAD superfamily hydrolase